MLTFSCAWAVESSGAAVAKAIRDTTLDAEACFRVRDLNFAKEDYRFYLTDGFVIFAKPVMGHRLFALFSADVEGGDAELLLMPPHRNERRSLASFAGSPNLSEHFTTALFVFSDGTGDDLFEQARDSGRQNIEMGTLLSEQLGTMARNITGGFEIRLVQDVLSQDLSGGIFFAAVAGTKLGNFDILHDPWSQDQILIGQYTTKGLRPIFDIWASFESRSIRSGKRARHKPPFRFADYRIDAALDESLNMKAVTRAKLIVSQPTRAFGVQVSEKMTITSVTLDGQPVELYVRESPREAALRTSANVTFVVVAPDFLQPGSQHEIEFQHEGSVVLPAGNGVFFVTSRGNWYPRAGYDFTNFDLRFTYPKRLTLVATGEPAGDIVEGEYKISRRTTSTPVRLAGFNLGDYEQVKLNQNGYTIEVFGNRRLEPGLQPRPVQPPVMVPAGPARGPRRLDPLGGISLPPPAPPNPLARLSSLAGSIAGSFEYMRNEYGPPPIKWLTVSPIPGAFGQGFPGLVYLSTLAYLSPEERPASLRNRSDDLFFGELLAAHEVAHQWWGNSVAAARYEDDWLMEALASYSSLQYLEKRRGSRAIESILGDYQEHLLKKGEDGRTVESMGPVIWGLRLQSSQSEVAWRTIVYEKGAWIMHMLRRRMGDAKFGTLLAEVTKRYAREVISTEQFRLLAEEVMGGNRGSDGFTEFFDTWVYGTGIPSLQLSYTVKGKAPSVRITGTLTQSGVDDEFGADVPVEIHFAGRPPITHWVKTSAEPATFTITVKQAPARVVVPAGTGILAVRK